MTTTTVAQRITSFIAAEPEAAWAVADIAEGDQPEARGARRAQDCGLCDYNRHDGWTLTEAGRQVANEQQLRDETIAQNLEDERWIDFEAKTMLAY